MRNLKIHANKSTNVAPKFEAPKVTPCPTLQSISGIRF